MFQYYSCQNLTYFWRLLEPIGPVGPFPHLWSACSKTWRPACLEQVFRSDLPWGLSQSPLGPSLLTEYLDKWPSVLEKSVTSAAACGFSYVLFVAGLLERVARHHFTSYSSASTLTVRLCFSLYLHCLLSLHGSSDPLPLKQTHHQHGDLSRSPRGLPAESSVSVPKPGEREWDCPSLAQAFHPWALSPLWQWKGVWGQLVGWTDYPRLLLAGPLLREGACAQPGVHLKPWFTVYISSYDLTPTPVHTLYIKFFLRFAVKA